MKTIATVVLGMTLATGVWAQSTDPSNPSAWTSLGVNGRGVGRDITYYYAVPSEAGTIQSHLQAQGQGGTAEMSIELFDSGRAWLGEAEAGLAADLCGERLEVELQPSEGAPVARFLLTFAGGALTSVAED